VKAYTTSESSEESMATARDVYKEMKHSRSDSMDPSIQRNQRIIEEQEEELQALRWRKEVAEEQKSKEKVHDIKSKLTELEDKLRMVETREEEEKRVRDGLMLAAKNEYELAKKATEEYKEYANSQITGLRSFFVSRDKKRNIQEDIQQKEKLMMGMTKLKEEMLDDEKMKPSDDITIVPNDSVTVVGMPLSNRLTKNVVGSNFDCVVHGYSQDEEQRADEIEAYSQIKQISGCPIIFSDQRLNFLINLHKHLYIVLTDIDQYPAMDSLPRIVRFVEGYAGKKRPAHVQLLYQVIRSTISFSSSLVRANPFNLPILEVGMEISDRIIMMCFDKLHNEFETRWFTVMKDVEPPKFHDKYNKFSNENYTSERIGRRQRNMNDEFRRPTSRAPSVRRHDSASRPQVVKKHGASSTFGSVFSSMK
jgi:hypothetical protein